MCPECAEEVGPEQTVLVVDPTILRGGSQVGPSEAKAL